jgi:AcrR family transcriptional regulator
MTSLDAFATAAHDTLVRLYGHEASRDDAEALVAALLVAAFTDAADAAIAERVPPEPTAEMMTAALDAYYDAGRVDEEREHVDAMREALTAAMQVRRCPSR